MNSKYKVFLIILISIVISSSSIYFIFSDGELILKSCSIIDRITKSCVITALLFTSQIESEETFFRIFSEITHELEQKSSCHRLAHMMGNLMYGHTDNLSLSLSNINERLCAGAMIHGVMKGYFSSKSSMPEENSLLVYANKLCDEYYTIKYSQSRNECIHGIGHGLTIKNDYKVFVSDKECDFFKDDFSHRACLRGVFMEYAIHSKNNNHTYDSEDLLEKTNIVSDRSFDLKSEYFPCNVMVNEKYVSSCYTYYVGFLSNAKSPNNFLFCDEIKNEKYVKNCYYGSAFYRTQGDSNFEDVLLNCSKGDLYFQPYCISGGVYSLLDRNEIEPSFSLCESAPKNSQFECYSVLGKWIHTIYFTQPEIEEMCSRLQGSDFFTVCIDANPNDLGLI